MVRVQGRGEAVPAGPERDLPPGHPLVGDETYGARQNARLKELTNYAAPRVMLHARELSFIHPRTEKEMSFAAPLPEDFRDALKFLRA